jgi:hypothetical protein
MPDTELPKTLDELLNYIEANLDGIYIREQVNGKWGSYALTEMPVERAIAHAFRFVREARIQVDRTDLELRVMVSKFDREQTMRLQKICRQRLRTLSSLSTMDRMFAIEP